MPSNELQQAVDTIREIVRTTDTTNLGDRELLQRCVSQHDEAAFEAIVRRHGPMVLGVCRRFLRNPHDAEDAFQATFLVFVRKAATLTHPELLGNWLYTIALHSARATQKAIERRRAKEAQMIPRQTDAAVEGGDEILPLLDEEIGRLPAKYRIPLVLCGLQQQSRADVAGLLGLSPGTLSSRLARARALLRKRLAQRGITLPGAAIAAVCVGNTPAPSATLVHAVLETSRGIFQGTSKAVNAGSAQAIKISETVLKMMFLSKLKHAGAVMVICALLTAGAGTLVAQHWGPGATSPDGAAQQNQAAVLPKDANARMDPAQEKVPEPVKVTLELKRDEFMLGESIAVDYQVTNNSTKPIRFEKGGFSPTLLINDCFRMSAIKIDGAGKQLGDPVATLVIPEDEDRKLSNFQIMPGARYSTILFVHRYLSLLEPGRYRLRIENLEWRLKNTLSSGETILVLKEPTPQQARQIFVQMKQASRKAYDDSSMKFLPEAADFQAMHQPVYLPVLREYAAKFDRDAFEALERMQRLDANEVLVTSLASALDRDDWRTARVCFHHLKNCLPFPNWYDEPLNEYNQADRERVARLWKPEFGPKLTQLARRLNVEVESLIAQRKSKPLDADAHDPKFLEVFRGGSFPPEHPQSLLEDIDYVYRCLGQTEDFSDCLTAYSQAIELTKSLPLETHQYFRPRGSAFGFSATVMYMLRRGARVPAKLVHPGEAAAFAIGIRTQENFRPTGWQAELIKWLKSNSPYLAEVILDHFPDPIPAEVLDYLPTALSHDYVDLQIAACKIAQKNPRPAYRKPLQKILDTAKDKYLREFALETANANGI